MSEATETRPGDVIVIVPTYNEAENIEAIPGAVRSQGAPLLVVDDGSPNGTGAAVDVLASDDDGISVLHRVEKAGLGRAYGQDLRR